MFARGGLVGFDPANGRLDFHFPWRAPILESVNASNPVVVGDLVFISETYGPGSALLRVKPGEAEAWSGPTKSGGGTKPCKRIGTRPSITTAICMASSGRHTENAELRCVELATGKVMWSQPDLTRSSLLYVDGHFVCLERRRHVAAAARQSEKVRPGGGGRAGRKSRAAAQSVWLSAAATAEVPAWAAPILSHGLLYVRGADRLVCLELIPGSKAAK